MPNPVTPLKKGQSIRGTWIDKLDAKRDESGIPARQLAGFLVDRQLPPRDVLQAQTGVTPRMIHRIMNIQQDVVSLGVVDRLLDSVGEDVCALTYHGILTAVPFRGEKDAFTMAVYENLDDDDKLTVPWGVIKARAAELLVERESLI